MAKLLVTEGIELLSPGRDGTGQDGTGWSMLGCGVV